MRDCVAAPLGYETTTPEAGCAYWGCAMGAIGISLLQV